MGRERFESQRFETHKVVYDRDVESKERSEHIAPSALAPDVREEMELFDAVRNYIRENDVNEFGVAAHFGIPISRVKAWIREGRIEYKELDGSVFAEDKHCSLCGRPIEFGNICSKCKREQSGKGHGYAVTNPGDREEGKMRFHHDE